MRKIVVSMQNGLLAESISRMLEESSEFLIYRSVAGRRNSLVMDCVMYGAEIVLMEVSPGHGLSLQDRLEETKQIKHANPDCKIVLLCDVFSSQSSTILQSGLYCFAMRTHRRIWHGGLLWQRKMAVLMHSSTHP